MQSKDYADLIKCSVPSQPHAKHPLENVPGERNYGHTAVRFKTNVIVQAYDGMKIHDLVTGQWTETNPPFGLNGKSVGVELHTCNLIRGRWLILLGGHW